jgi:hypothetical protein
MAPDHRRWRDSHGRSTAFAAEGSSVAVGSSLRRMVPSFIGESGTIIPKVRAICHCSTSTCRGVAQALVQATRARLHAAMKGEAATLRRLTRKSHRPSLSVLTTLQFLKHRQRSMLPAQVGLIVVRVTQRKGGEQ